MSGRPPHNFATVIDLTLLYAGCAQWRVSPGIPVRVPHDTSTSDLARNLRRLCSGERSISEVCRRVGINRQQFNRYLTGASRPSAFNTQRLCHHFGVQEHELLLPHDEFERRFRGRRVTPAESRPGDRLDRLLRSAFPGDRRPLMRYTGYYHFYFRTPTWPDRLVCGVSSIHEREGLFFSKAVMRDLDRQDGTRYHSKYEGLVALRHDLLFIVETQTLAQDVIVETMLRAPRRSDATLLRGHTFGISNPTREPYLRPIVWRYLGRVIDLRAALRATGLVDPASGPVEQRVVRLLE